MGASGKGKAIKKLNLLSRKARKQKRKEKHLTVKQKQRMLARLRGVKK